MIELFHKAAEAVFVEIENSKTKIKREKIFEDVDCLYRYFISETNYILMF